MSDCIFCKIVQNKLPSYKIYEDENFLAFLDIFPMEYGHTVVIPKKHERFIWDIEDIGEYFKVCQKIAKHFQIVSNNEYVYSIVIGEGVPHAHTHIIPSESKTFGDKLSQFSKDLNYPKLDQKTAEEILKKYKIK